MNNLTTHKHRESSYLRAYKAPLHLSRGLYKSTLFMQNKPNFRKSQMNVSIFSQMAYEYKSNWTLGENKPNTNPIKPNFRKAKMNVSSVLTKDYNNEQRTMNNERLCKTNPIKPNLKGKKYDTIVAYKLESGAQKVAAIRRRLDEAGQYGTRVAVHVGDITAVRLPPLYGQSGRVNNFAILAFGSRQIRNRNFGIHISPSEK